MKVDLLLIPFGATYGAMKEAARAAEASGFDGIWTWDHLRVAHGAGEGVPECMTVLAALAGATSRVALGSLVLNVVNRHPAVLANMGATVQDISGGRFILGIGAGGSRATPYAAEQLAIGQPVEDDATRAERVAEAIEVVRRLWSGDSSDFAGEHYKLQSPAGYLKPDPPPPIVVGGFGHRMATLAGRLADGFNTQAQHPQLRQLLDSARREHAASGRAQPFLATAFAGLSQRWLQPESRERQALERVQMDRLVLLVEPPYQLDQIQAAGRLKERQGT